MALRLPRFRKFSRQLMLLLAGLIAVVQVAVYLLISRANERNQAGKQNPVNVLKKLQNPFALVVQGFIVGGVLFWTTQGQATQAPAAPAPVAQSASAN